MNKNVEDLDFVFSEIVRISELRRTDKTKLPTNDYFASLPHPSGKGEMLCGTAALVRLRAVAQRAISSSKFAGRIESDEVYRTLKKEITRRFFVEQRPLNDSEADKAVSAALRTATKRIVSLTHLLPCHLAGLSGPSEFSIGPVRFRKRSDALIERGKSLSDYVDDPRNDAVRGSTNGYRELKEKLLLDAQKHYESFDWVAEIRVEETDTNTSRKRASQVAQGALNCLHLLLGREYSHHMRCGGPDFAVDRRGRLEFDSHGKAEVWTSIDWLSHFITEAWWEKLNQDKGHEIIQLLGIALTAGNAVPNPSPLALRFLDALAWYGEAVRDDFVASRIVKYVTTIERILTTKKAKDLTQTIASRGSALTFAPGEENLQDLADRFSSIYGVRSELVHGSISPLASALWKADTESEELARVILFRALQFFGKDGFELSSYSEKRLDRAYDKVLAWAQAAMNAATETEQPGNSSV